MFRKCWQRQGPGCAIIFWARRDLSDGISQAIIYTSCATGYAERDGKINIIFSRNIAPSLRLWQECRQILTVVSVSTSPELPCLHCNFIH
jgi:hypothetical protein